MLSMVIMGEREKELQDSVNVKLKTLMGNA